MVVTIAIPVRKVFRLTAYFTQVHFDRLAKLLLLTSIIVGFAYATEYFMAWYSAELFERDVFWDRLFGDYWFAGWSMVIFNAVLPQLLWFPKIRQNLNAFFIITIFVNIGMWYERFVIIVPSLSRSYEPWKFLNYHMGVTEAIILLGSFGWFFMWFLLFMRFLPIISMAEIKEILPPPMSKQSRAQAAHDQRRQLVEELPTGYKEYERR